MAYENFEGRRYGSLEVISQVEKIGAHRRWYVLCDCGVTKTVRGSDLKKGTKSCGCIRKALGSIGRKNRRSHGYTGTRTYNCWLGIKRRCYKENFKQYKDYGGRGIKMCERWHIFENFLLDMGEMPKGSSIDRINNDGDYTQSNCRWASPKEQAANRRKTNLDGLLSHSVITPNDIEPIRKMVNGGMSRRAVARSLGCSAPVINRVMNGTHIACRVSQG